MQLHWYATNVNFFSPGKYVKKQSEMFLYSIINLNEM